MSDSSNSEVSFKLFAYKGIAGCGLITVPEVINDSVYAEHSCLIKHALDRLYVLVEEKECY